MGGSSGRGSGRSRNNGGRRGEDRGGAAGSSKGTLSFSSSNSIDGAVRRAVLCGEKFTHQGQVIFEEVK